MIDIRESSLIEIENRISRDKDLIGLKSFYRNSSILIDKTFVPSIKIIEGKDLVQSVSSGGASNHVSKRLLEVDLQIISNDNNDKGASIKNLFYIVRRAILCVKDDNNQYVVNTRLTDKSFLTEINSIGPMSYEVSGLIGMILTVGVNYIDGQLIF